jgi:hypothetical protein
MPISCAVNELHVTRVSRTHRLLLWAMRSWVIGLKRRFDVLPTLREAFGRLGMPEAAEPLDALMSIVACGAIRPLTIECVCAAAISEDESRLLAVAALHQAKRGFEARFLLREMLDPAASCAAGEVLERLAAIFSAANAELTPRSLRTGRFAFAPAPESDEAPNRPTLH